MPYANCWNCGRGDVEILPGDDFVSCKCGATGPSPDKGGRLWDALSRLTYDGWAPAERAEPIAATLETADSGPMPWRLAIAAQMWAACFTVPSYDIAREGFDRASSYWIALADALIAAHRAGEKGGAA